MLFVAEIYSFEELHSEIEEILITDHLVENWTYPMIQPKLIEEARSREYLQPCKERVEWKKDMEKL